MADPKYANLPGIAYDQPDIYETADLPEADQPEVPYEEENEAIERGHLNPSVSFLKFKDKQLISDGVDFSDRLKKGPKRGYDARSGDWELAGAGEKETPLQKFQRLRCEVSELEEEISKLKESVKSTDKDTSDLKNGEDSNYAQMASEIETVQKHLSNLRLEELLGADVISSLQDPQGSQLRKLMTHLEEFQKKGPETSAKKSEGGATSASQPGVITYQLNYRPEQVKLAQSTRVAELEQRLYKLEAALGTTPELMKKLSAETHEKSLLEAVNTLSAKLALLEPAHVEHVDVLLAALGVKMDNLAEKAAKGQADLDRDNKISELYDVVTKTEPVTQLLPQTIERLIALESLHRQAGDFAKALSQLESVQSQLVNNLQENKTVLDGVKKSFAENIDTIKSNIAALERRIAALAPKK